MVSIIMTFVLATLATCISIAGIRIVANGIEITNEAYMKDGQKCYRKKVKLL